MPVTHIEITARQPYANGQPFGQTGPYTQIDGTAHFAVDPLHPANQTIADIRLAPRNPHGQVEFAAGIRILQPDSGGRARLLLDIPNRGRPLALRNLNSAPETPPDAPPHPGNGFLMRQGYTIAWCGWQHDVPDAPGLLRIHAPQAQENGRPVSGKIAVTFQPNAPTQTQYLADRMHRPYPADNLEDWESVLTVQDHEDAPEKIIPRRQWWFARIENGRRIPDPCHIHLDGGFQPGKVYQVIYATTGSPVAGLGLLATRDIAAHLRYDDHHSPNIERAYAFGVSQSGRFLRSFLYHALNRDESGRLAFDGFLPHVAGAKRGEFNRRFAQPSSQATRAVNNLFPFADAPQTDPETGQTDGLLSRLAAQGELPKIIYTNTSSEYWAGHGSLLHTTIDGQTDAAPPPSVRIYAFAGTQHALSGLPLTDTDTPAPGETQGPRGAHPFNCLDYRPLLRAALTNLDQWASRGAEPPPSQYPRINPNPGPDTTPAAPGPITDAAIATAVPPQQLAPLLETIPGVKLPHPIRQITRLDFGPDPAIPALTPPGVGRPYPALVSAVDPDGNETAGIRLPLISVPLATHLGWNRRHPDIGGAGQTLSTGGASGGTLRGATIPFPAAPQQRQAAADPRPSIQERYPSQQAFLAQIETAAHQLTAQGYLLPEDLTLLITEAAQHYAAMTAPAG